MASLIQEIENNEALMLLFINKELPPEDCAEMEQMLSGDSGMRAELERMKTACEFTVSSLAKLDADQAAAAGENHAIRQAKRAMRQWQVERLNRQSTPLLPVRRHIPSWAYGSAAAGLLLIGTLTYWGIVGESGNSNSGLPGVSSTIASRVDSRDGDHRLDRSNPASPLPAAELDAVKVAMLESSLDRSEVNSGIADAETQANSLMARSDNASASSSILLFHAE